MNLNKEDISIEKLFLFHFYFISFYFGNLGLGVSMMSHMTITSCHKSLSQNYISHKNIIEDFRINNIIPYINSI